MYFVYRGVLYIMDTLVHVLYNYISLSLYRWFISKQSKPLREEIVRFPPYSDCVDMNRGTTVLPYLEVFYDYKMLSNVEPTRWDSQDEEGLFGNDSRSVPSATQSLASVSHVSSHERSMETISGRRSRVQSQENGMFVNVSIPLVHSSNLSVNLSVNFSNLSVIIFISSIISNI